MKFNHVGIPTAGSFAGEIPLPHLEVNGAPVELMQIDHQVRPDL